MCSVKTEPGERTYSHGEMLSDEHAERADVLIPGQMDLSLFRDNCAHPDKRIVDTFAHGKFPTEDPQKQVILASHLQRHIDAWHENISVQAFGLDVARSKSGDETMLAAGGMEGLRKLHPWHGDSVTEHARETMRIANDVYGIDLRLGKNPVCVDTDGLGSGTADMLRDYRVWVIEFRGNMVAQVVPKAYKNWRTEAYALLGRRLDPGDKWEQVPWALPPGERMLYEELTAPEKIYSRGDAFRFGLSPKRKDQSNNISVEEKIGRSPDRGDATVYLFTAVRILHNMNEFFAQFAGDVVYSGESLISEGAGEPIHNISGLLDDLDVGPVKSAKVAETGNGSGRWSQLFPDDD